MLPQNWQVRMDSDLTAGTGKVQPLIHNEEDGSGLIQPYLNGCQHRGNIINGAPLILQNIQANLAIHVN